MRKKITSTDHSKIGKGKSINSFQSIKPRKCLDDQSGDTGEKSCKSAGNTVIFRQNFIIKHIKSVFFWGIFGNRLKTAEGFTTPYEETEPSFLDYL